jgi:dTDP-4-dehydrorhamnose reductase
MLGHKLIQVLREDFDVAGTVRSDRIDPLLLAHATADTPILTGITVEDFATVERAIKATRPDVVLNCVGIIKQLKEAQDPIPAIAVNALFPHRLAALTRAHGIRLIHFSTDCVFSGRKGGYTESDIPDAQDLYGRTKLLGEIDGPNCLTIRSSIIGHELGGHLSLVDWFMSQRGGKVNGFARAHYSGLTTMAMAELVRMIIDKQTDLAGLWQVSSDAINKYDLLQIINSVYGLGISIDRDEIFFCDRTLDGSRFRARTGWRAQHWQHMIEIMQADWQQCAYRLGKSAHE